MHIHGLPESDSQSSEKRSNLPHLQGAIVISDEITTLPNQENQGFLVSDPKNCLCSSVYYQRVLYSSLG